MIQIFQPTSFLIGQYLLLVPTPPLSSLIQYERHNLIAIQREERLRDRKERCCDSLRAGGRQKRKQQKNVG
jgi:hypothetical protein